MSQPLELQHVGAKIFLDGDLQIDPEAFIPVFHRWIGQQALDELLIDVADYRHVPAGPGVLLVAFEADYGMDNTGNRYGLRYNRKAPLAGTNQDRFRQALRSALHAARLLEAELEGSLQFSRQEFELQVNDRALAPNTPETYAACKAELDTLLNNVLGHDQFQLAHQSDPRRCFSVTIKAAKPLDLAAVLEALQGG